MHARHWLAACLAAILLLAVALVLTGGIYRTVDAGEGGVYVLNRFTGSARRLEEAPDPRPPKPDPATAAVDLVRNEPADTWLTSEYPGATVDEWLRNVARRAKGRVRTIGWKAQRQHDGLYVVSFRADRPGRKPVKGLAWEVDLDNRVVRFINDDEELAKHYGFEPMRSSGAAPTRSGPPPERWEEELDRAVKEDRESRFIPSR